MDGTLKISNNTLAYADVGTTSNPTKKYVDWTTQRQIPVRNPKSNAVTVDPGATLTLFNSVRSLQTDSSSSFELMLSTLESDRYRLAYQVGGTDPQLRTMRVGGAGLNYTIAVNVNNTVTLTASSTNFSAVAAGDTVFIPDTTTGDAASPFNPINVGYWNVLAKLDDSTLQLVRPPGQAFAAIAETVAAVTNQQLVFFSAAGVQVGDSFRLSAGLPQAAWGTYKVVSVSWNYVEFISTRPLPTSVTGNPGATGLQFYPLAKRFMRVEGDQSFILRWNGDTTNLNQIDPWEPADADRTGWDEKTGPVWQAVVVNLSSSAQLNLTVITAE